MADQRSSDQPPAATPVTHPLEPSPQGLVPRSEAGPPIATEEPLVGLDAAVEPLTVAIGSGVRLRGRPRYLKTADPMPMLRPPDLVDGDEVGTVVEQRALDLLAVRFRRGTFLLPRTDVQPAAFTD